MSNSSEQIVNLGKEALAGFIKTAESSLKMALQDTYDEEIKKDIEAWAKEVTYLQERIIREGYTETLKLTESYLEMGVQAVLRRAQRRVESQSNELLASLWESFKTAMVGFLKIAVASAVAGAIA